MLNQLSHPGAPGFIVQMGGITASFYGDENDPVGREELMLVRKERTAGIMSTCRQVERLVLRAWIVYHSQGSLSKYMNPLSKQDHQMRVKCWKRKYEMRKGVKQLSTKTGELQNLQKDC